MTNYQEGEKYGFEISVSDIDIPNSHKLQYTPCHKGTEKLKVRNIIFVLSKQ